MAAKAAQVFQARQGDILFVREAALPNGKRRLVKGRAIVRGAATGHTHRLRASKGAQLVEAAGVLFVRATGRAHVDHEEHDSIALPKGVYRVVRQAEFDPTTMQRTVAD